MISVETRLSSGGFIMSTTRSFRKALSRCILCLGIGWIHLLAPAQEESADPLTLDRILADVTSVYPPYLAALMQRDIANGKFLGARGAFDLEFYAAAFGNPTGFYEYTNAEAGLEQYTGFAGSKVFAKYKFTRGLLPDYYSDLRTDGLGAPLIGVKTPLLRDRAIDKERATLRKADLYRQIADPQIRSQQQRFAASAMSAYFKWVGAGLKLQATSRGLDIATERAKAVKSQIEKGLLAPMTDLENRQSILQWETYRLNAQREFEIAALQLALFLRDDEGDPVVPADAELPTEFPEAQAISTNGLLAATRRALRERPEIEYLNLELEAKGIDVALSKNALLPELNASVAASQGLGDRIYKDKGDFELDLGIEFRVPIQRRAAKGNLEVSESELEQLEINYRFQLDTIANETRTAFTNLQNARERMSRTFEFVTISNELRDIESDRFKLGASDFIKVQVREQNAFSAMNEYISAQVDYFDALADFLKAAAVDYSVESQTLDALIAQAISG